MNRAKKTKKAKKSQGSLILNKRLGQRQHKSPIDVVTPGIVAILHKDYSFPLDHNQWETVYGVSVWQTFKGYLMNLNGWDYLEHLRTQFPFSLETLTSCIVDDYDEKAIDSIYFADHSTSHLSIYRTSIFLPGMETRAQINGHLQKKALLV